MGQFKNILLVVAPGAPGESAALDRAMFLGRTNGASLTVAGVVRSMKEREACTAAVRGCREKIEDLVEPFRGAGVPITTSVLFGTPFLEIIRQVVHNGHDLVIMTEKPEPSGAVPGHTSRQLLRKCPCPLWLLGPAERVPYRRVLAAVDPSSDVPEKIALNRKVLETAAAITESESCELHVAHAWRIEFEKLFRSRSPQRTMRRLLRTTREERAIALWQLAAPFIGSRPHQFHVKKGDPAKIIPLLARRNDIDLVVMGTTARTGIAAMLLGNTAEQVLGRVECSLLTVKPEGFLTPVRLTEPQTLDWAA
jgi:universal stress protein E